MAAAVLSFNAVAGLNLMTYQVAALLKEEQTRTSRTVLTISDLPACVELSGDRKASGSVITPENWVKQR
jgi:hypothetical protein